MKEYFIAVASIIILFTSTGVGLSQNKDSLPQTIIKKTAERYAAISSYQDSGVVETIGGASLPARSTDIFFKTYFTRPRKLRFEWTDYSPLSSVGRNIVWSDGVKTFGFYSFEPDKIETKESLELGIAGATGVSRGSAHTVPNLLTNEIGGFSLAELTKLTLKGQEQFEGEDCFVLEGYHPNGEAWQLWIGKKDFLLRKLRTKSTNGEFEEEIHRAIKTDIEISEAVYHPKIAGGRVTDVISKEKEENIKRLLDLVVPRDRVNQQLNNVLSILKEAMPQVPEKVWRDVIAELHLDSEMVIQIYVPIYDKHYTDEEIKQLIALYESPLGQKMRRSTTLIELEAAHRGETIGRELIKRIQEKLQSKGYKSA